MSLAKLQYVLRLLLYLLPKINISVSRSTERYTKRPKTICIYIHIYEMRVQCCPSLDSRRGSHKRHFFFGSFKDTYIDIILFKDIVFFLQFILLYSRFKIRTTLYEYISASALSHGKLFIAPWLRTRRSLK